MAFDQHAVETFLSFFSQDMGTIVLGKVESGIITKGQILTLMPNKVCSSLPV